MKTKRRPDAAWFYAAGILLVLSFRLMEHKTTLPFLSSVFFGLELTFNVSMLLVWLDSVRRRLLPSPARSCIVAAAILFLFFLAMSTVNYRIVDQNDLAAKRFCWYLYYVTLLFAPTLFLITCLTIAHGKRAMHWGAACLTVSGILLAFVLTNDLHYLVFVPDEPTYFYTGYGYGYGPVYYIGAAFVALEALSGTVRLAVLFRKRAQLFLVLLPLLLMPFYLPLSRYLHVATGVMFLLMPQYCIFCITCFFEFCIRFRLIPYNQNYAAFFKDMRYPAVITDIDLQPVYRTSSAVDASPAQLRQALVSPVYVTEDLRLSGKPLKAGSVFYTEDMSELNRMNERLSDANELLETEHTLIKAENDLREQKAQTHSRSRIYAEISKKTYDRQKTVSELLRNTSPDAPDFDRVLARVSLLNAWIKRSANLLLVNEGADEIDARELTLAMEESARYLVYLGVRMDVSGDAAGKINRETAFDVYETFETVVEALTPGMKRILAAFTDEGLRLVTDAAPPEEMPDTPLPAKVRQSEGLTYFHIPFYERGAAQ